jgi:condensin-2 complex subunit D3
MMPHQLPGSKTPTPESIRAHAFTVLGKLCLRDEALAKKSLNLLARELHPTTMKTASPAVQSNTLLVLGDLCVRYTNMADRYLPVMASCLQAGTSDPDTNILNNGSSGSAIVRKHAVLLLSSLLLQDYIKWRGLLFHRFLVATSDEDEGVAHLAETVLCGPLWLRNQKLFFNHFVEALFVLNRCTAHPIYVAAATMGDGGSGIAVGFEGIQLRGAVGEARRRGMYEFLLSKMSDEEKIGVTARLAKEVLGGALNSHGDLGRVCQRSTRDSIGPSFESAWNVMTDAFYILTSKAIKVGKVLQEEDDIEDPNVPNPSRQVSIAKGRLLSKISRKHLIEIVLPILCNLKTLLQSSCSPLLKDLMNYMLDIFKNYKVEVKEFLANDPTLLQEIEYDARQYSQQNSV